MLDKYREEIDRLDSEIIKSFERRMEISKEIAQYKLKIGKPIMDYSREREKLEKIASMSSEDMVHYTNILFNTIMDLSKDYQRKSQKKISKLGEKVNTVLNETDKQFPIRATIACQGVEGAYSQQACDKIFKIPKIDYVKRFDDVFEKISSGECRYGILPLENSTAGSVNKVYDLMIKHNFYIVRSVKLKVDHCLLTKEEIDREEIREIFSHEQAILQCEEYLKKCPKAKITVCENTAEASKMVSDSNRRDVAAISSYSCSKIYDLKCLERDIQDRDNNYTRFICISKNLEIYPGANKTSLMMVLPHRAGSLYKILSRINTLGINLLKLESRPIPKRDFDFMFYFDLDVDVYSEEFSEFINQLEELSDEYKYLGSYMEI
ncbi:bifunctional chorismate mutase/prephenate dehydratase [Anaerosphaera multitolerans]|uniref:Bifunctional chorismate mutase/prephenate dehydratase n=1 Tax=Anaerosphaera multitolerans TaxID=2487351 RepID=A0A437S638_9FIRM|nr:bifunctional chorismate mutase/prephenate dehydratase [Anaerosphaera multitolerans]RVU54495.1 bifunctional chorismate mutase/prephenate dehydratase [Anaerosphaera multitolerans]